MNNAARKLPNSLGKARVEIAVQSNTAIPVIVVMQQVMIVKGHPALSLPCQALSRGRF